MCTTIGYLYEDNDNYIKTFATYSIDPTTEELDVGDAIVIPRGVIIKNGKIRKLMERSKVLTVISLGVGVQSSTMALMSAKGVLPKVDCAIFADTGYEPKKVYEYLEWIKTQLPFPVYTVMKGNIKDDMIGSIDNGTRFPTAPFFTRNAETGKKGMLMRQCTNDYKIQPIRKKIRQLCDIQKGKHFPKDKIVDQWIGISMDEISRMKPARDKYINNVHPLIDLKMSRSDCLKWMSANVFSTA